MLVTEDQNIFLQFGLYLHLRMQWHMH